MWSCPDFSEWGGPLQGNFSAPQIVYREAVSRRIAAKSSGCYNIGMTYRELWEKRLGKEGVKRLPRRWQLHIEEMDKLPKMVKKISARRYRELIRGY